MNGNFRCGCMECPTPAEQPPDQEDKHNDVVQSPIEAQSQSNSKGKKTGPNYHWCIGCRSSADGGGTKQHLYSATHRSKLLALLVKQFEATRGAKHFLHNVTPVPSEGNGSYDSKFWCLFCDSEVDNKDNKFVAFATLKHLQSNKHRRAVEVFWGVSGAYLLKKQLQEKRITKKKFSVGQPAYRQFLIALKQYRETPDPGPPLLLQTIYDPKAKTLQQCAYVVNPKLQDTTGNVQPKVIKLEEKQKPELKTIVSPQGILQNPSGWYEGQRVWGGGIVKVKKEEWLPWDIDLDEEADVLIEPTQYQSEWWNKSEPAQQQQVLRPPSVELPKAETPRGVRTVKAIAENLTVIELPPLAPGEGNVHTGATPPWLIDKDGKLRNLSAKKKSPNTQKLGANLNRDKLRAAVASSNFLPNFGRLWNAGPRSDSRKEFLEEQEKIVQSQDPLVAQNPQTEKEGEQEDEDVSPLPKRFRSFSPNHFQNYFK